MESTRPDVTFVCCVESGYLEAQTLRLIGSLRKFGGRFAAAKIIAVTPRFGPPISAKTLRLFAIHDVKYLRQASVSRYSWFNFYNKPLALVAAHDQIETNTVAFLDSDLLILDEPDLLELHGTDEFASFPTESKEMGTTGPGDEYEPLWEQATRAVGLSLDDLPWVMTAQTNQRVRLYFNGGLFAYRHSSNFGSEYLRLCRSLLDSRIGTSATGYGLGFNEMVSIGFAVMTLNLNWRPLPYSYNYPMLSKTFKNWYSREALAAARIVHYHDSMWPPFWNTFLESMWDARPTVARWLESLGPMANVAPIPYKILSRVLRTCRQRQSNSYLSNAILFN